MARPVSQDKQIAVSPKMIEAGLRAIEAWKDLPLGELVAAVYRAMAAVAIGDGTDAAAPSPTITEIMQRLERLERK
jgi:hypothetical protein